MVTIQVVLDSDLLRDADQAAKRANVNRSALVRDALREHLRRMRIQDLERRDRQGYERHPDTDDELVGWGGAASWGDE